MGRERPNNARRRRRKERNAALAEQAANLAGTTIDTINKILRDRFEQDPAWRKSILEPTLHWPSDQEDT